MGRVSVVTSTQTVSTCRQKVVTSQILGKAHIRLQKELEPKSLPIRQGARKGWGGRGKQAGRLQEVGGEEAARFGANCSNNRFAQAFAKGVPGHCVQRSQALLAMLSPLIPVITQPYSSGLGRKKGLQSGRRPGFPPLSHSPANFYSISQKEN